MRIFLIFFLIMIFKLELYAQNSKVTKESSTENLKELTNNIFKYPAFVKGKIISKDSSAIDAKLNYDRVLGKVLYIDRIGKALPLENLETIEKVIIATDTFYLYNNNFIEKYTHFANVNLYIKQTISYIEKQQKVNDGTPVIISNGSKLPYSYEEPKTEDITIEKSSLFKLSNEYFIANQSMNLYAVTKKSFYDLFPKYKDELKTFMQDHSVNFNNIDQMEKLLQYMNSL
jgi:hypothetical protein